MWQETDRKSRQMKDEIDDVHLYQKINELCSSVSCVCLSAVYCHVFCRFLTPQLRFGFLFFFIKIFTVSTMKFQEWFYWHGQIISFTKQLLLINQMLLISYKWHLFVWFWVLLFSQIELCTFCEYTFFTCWLPNFKNWLLDSPNLYCLL